MLRKVAFLLASLIGTIAVKATHMSGGEIYWECIGPNQFRIQLLVYRDCAGIDVDPNYNLVLTSPCGDRDLTVSTNGGTELSQLCDLELPNSTCNGGTLPGIEQYIYTGTITLPPCDSWEISWTNIYRNNAIVNLTNPGTRQMYIESILNSADAPCNDSPTFTNSAIPYICLGYPVAYSYGAVDAEADSLSYSLIGARMINGDPIPYVAPYTPAQPIDGLSLDPVTGLLNFTLNMAGNWVVVVQVTEYDDNGNVIGSIMRDMQFVAYPCANVPPDASTGTVTGLTGTATQTGDRAVQVCESGDFCFDMVISDANVTNVLEAFSNAAQNLPGATFNYSGSNPITATLCWTAQPGTAGFYPLIVNVSDGACPIPAFQTYVYSIEVLSGLSASVQVVDETCAGFGNGSATVDVTAGTAPYTYTWSTGSTEASINAGAGTYTVEVVDANGCMSDVLTGTIGTGAEANQANAGNDLVACGDSGPIALNGTVTNATGGAWSNGSGNLGGAWPNNTYLPSPGERTSGSVTLVLTTTGNTGCPAATDTLVISLPNSFTGVSITSTDALCNNGSSGTATVQPVVPQHTYLWNDPASQTTPTATALQAGVHAVTITDGYGCDSTLSVTISEPQPITVTNLVPVAESCQGSGNGTLTATASGGTAPYTYTWNTGTTGAVLTATSGTYSVTVTDANNCTPASASASITYQGLPNQVDAGPDLVGCNDAFPIALVGTVTNATGGSWSGGSGAFTGSWPNISYQPSAMDIANGSVTLSLTTIGNTTCPPASDQLDLVLPSSFNDLTITASNATCFNSTTGSVSVAPDNGYSYQWSSGSTNAPTASDLTAGSYSVVVTDAYGCDTTMSAVIDEPDAITITDLVSVNEACAGTANGTLSATVAGGTAPYSYSWNTGATTATLTAAAGTYTVSVTDANGCSPATANGSIVATGQPNSANAGDDLVGCLGALPITVQGTVTNASSGIWSGGSGTFMGSGLSVQYMPTTAEIIAGGVDLLLTTTGNPTCPPASDQVHVTLSNTFLNIALTPSNVGCNGAANGSISYSPAISGLQYQWNDPLGQTTSAATGLTAGTYSVVVTDQLGCDTAMSATITEPAALVVAQPNIVDVTCNGANNGSASLTIQGGTPGYAVSWSSGQVGASIANLGPGTYTANVTDANGCAAQVMATISEPAPILVSVSAPDTVCVSTTNTFTANATGGAGGYLFNWGGFGFSPTVQLAFDNTQTIQLTVVDQAGCAGPTTPVTVTVLDLESATFTTYGDTTVCVGGSATVGASVSGYPADFTITWQPLGYNGFGPYTVPIADDQNLTVTISDACGTTVQRMVGLRLDIAPTFELPPLIAEGCAPLTVQFPDLGLGNVVHTWTLGNGGTSNMVAPTVIYQQGSYTASLTVTTPLGCTSSSTGGGSIMAYGAPTAAFSASTYETTIDASTVSFTNQSTGTIISNDWTFGDGGTSTVINPSYAFNEIGTFEVELHVVDAHGCEGSTSQFITITPVYDVVIPDAFTPNPNGPGGQSNGGGGNWVTGDLSNDVFYPFVRFVKDFRMRVFNRWGELVFESTDLSIGWDGYYRGQISPQDVYVVQTWFRFVDGKTVEKLSDLTLFR